MRPPLPPKRFRHVQGRLCGRVFPGWLPVLDEPHASLLLHHLSALHPVELTPLLASMATEDIVTVAMAAYERVPATRAGEETG